MRINLLCTFGMRGRCETRTLSFKNQMQILNELCSSAEVIIINKF